STEAGSDSGLASGPYCSTVMPAPTLCADFDTTDLPTPWDHVSAYGGGGVVLDNTLSKSAMRAMRATISGPGQSGANVYRDFTAMPTRAIGIDLDLYLVSLPDQPAAIAEVTMTNVNGWSARAALLVAASSISVGEGDQVTDGGMLYQGGNVQGTIAK